MADLALSGLASGFDWKAVVDQLTNVERAPQRRLLVEQNKINQQKEAVSKLVTELTSFKTLAEDLEDTSFFSSRTSTSSDDTIATASTTDSTPTGTYKFEITQLATNSNYNGTTGIGPVLSSTTDIDAAGEGPALSTANIAATMTYGFVTVNGTQVAVNASDTLGDVLARIKTALGGASTAVYNPSASPADRITLTKDGGGTISLGSSADTSNFLEVMRLSTGTSPVSSSMDIGRVNLANTVASTFGVATGTFVINGVTISYNSTDTVGSVLRSISDSEAGVDASYDSLNDQFKLTNKDTGSLGISVTDGAAGLLAAFGLTAGTLTAGDNVKFKLNGGTEQTGLGNTITDLHHGITGLTVNALKVATTTETDSYNPNSRVTISSFGASTTVNATAHGFDDGDKVRFLLANTPTSTPALDTTASYYVNKIGNNSFSVHETFTDAINNTNAIDFGGAQALTGTYAAEVTESTTSDASAAVTITVGKDTEAIKSAITGFVDQYNKIQSLIDTQTASSTDANGKVTAGILANDRSVHEIAHLLRAKMMSTVVTSGSVSKRLDFLGYDSDGFKNQLELADSDALDSALASAEGMVKDLFTITSNSDDQNGLAVQIQDYLDSMVGDDGLFLEHRDNFSTQASRIDTQIADMERQVQSSRQRMTDSFLAMEEAQQKINQQMQFLNQRFGK
jgi:flagellar hook-associated protein 2